jgi:P27 family predicted phage terminase small subunit
MTDKITTFAQCKVRGYNNLSARAKLDYRYVCERLLAKGSLRSCDLQLVMNYARCCEDVRLADEEITKCGILIKGFDRNGNDSTKPNPAIKIKYDAMAEMRQIALMFGITPQGRKRVNDDSSAEKSDLEKWMESNG